MKRVKQSKKTAIVVIAAVSAFLITALLVTVVLVKTRHKMGEIREGKIAELINRQGEYDERSIVLNKTNRGEVKRMAEKYNATYRMSSSEKYAVLTLPDDVTILDIFTDEDNVEDVAVMDIDWHIRTTSAYVDQEDLTHDIYMPSCSGISDELFNQQTYLSYLNLQNIWSYTRGDGVKVAIIDSGIDTDHPEFEGRISIDSYNASLDISVRDSALPGGEYDWSLIEDTLGHGTMVAGVLKAGMNNSGMVGIAPDVELLVIKADTSPNGNFLRASDLIFGIDYAISQDVNIINMSFGGTGDNVFRDICQQAADHGILLLASAGNSSSAEPFYPAADPNVIGVGALGNGCWTLADYSNYGDNVNLVAPGTGILTTQMGGGFCYPMGTSISCPVVAGILSLYYSYFRWDGLCLGRNYILERLFASTYDLGDPGNDFYYGNGAIDASALITENVGTVTFDYLTDEISETKQLFIRNHTLQNYPEPERLYAVFDGWYYDDQCTEECDLKEDILINDLTLYAKWINEDDGVPYTYENVSGGVEITSYRGHRRYITLPEQIDGRAVVSIGYGAFAGNTTLRQINLPASLIKIKDSAFKGCNNLISVVIPGNVTEIGNDAFTDCVRMSSVSFAAGSMLTTIGDRAFANCSGLKSFSIPAYVSSLNGSAFLGCTNMLNFEVAANSEFFSTSEGVLFNMSRDTLVAYPAGRGGAYTIPGVTASVGQYAFAFGRITEIDLSEIDVIGDCAFISSSLEQAVIPASVTRLGRGAFSGCEKLSSVSIGSGVSEISPECFANDLMITELTVPANVFTIGANAFANDSIAVLNFAQDSNVQIIGSGAFSGCELTALLLPDSVTTISSGAFANNLKLASVNLYDCASLSVIGDSAFAGCSKLTSVTFPASLVSIGSGAFRSCALETVLIPASVTDYGFGVFSGCSALPAITVDPGNTSIKSIDGVVFTYDGRTLIEYPSGNNTYEYFIPEGVERIGEQAFAGAQLSYVTFDPTLKHIDAYAFSGCSNLTNITLPRNLITIGAGAFAGNTNLWNIGFENHSKLRKIESCAFASCGVQNIMIPATVTEIGENAFGGCSRLSWVGFEDNSELEHLTKGIFSGCISLNTIEFRSGSLLTSIDDYALENLPSLTNLYLDGATGLRSIGNYAFRFDGFWSFNIPEGVTELGRCAFYQCSAMGSVDIPASMISIGSFAFLGVNENCVAYFALDTLPEGLQDDWDRGLAGYAVGVAATLTDGDWEYAELNNGGIAITKYNGTETNIDLNAVASSLGHDIIQISGYCFAGTPVESIVLPDTLEMIQRKAFFATGLRAVTIPANVTFIGNNAFANTLIETLTFAPGSNIEHIEYSAFEKTHSLTSVTLPASVRFLGKQVFMESGLEELTFEQGIRIGEIPELGFAGTKLTSVVIPDGVTRISEGAFRDVRTLTSLTLPTDNELRIMADAFYMCGLNSLYIPANVRYIGEYAFIGLENLNEYNVDADNAYYKAVDGVLFSKVDNKLIAFPAKRTGSYTIPANVETIGFGAFEDSHLTTVIFENGSNLLTIGCRAFFGADNLTEITIPASVISIDYYAFAYASSLESVYFSPGNRITGIYEGAFYGCESLANINFPDTVIEISDYAFFGCESLTHIPVSATSEIVGIYDYALAYTGLTGELTLPDTLYDIGTRAFMGTKVTKVIVPDRYAEELIMGFGAFEACDELVEIHLPFIGKYFDTVSDGSWFGYVFGAGNKDVNEQYIPASLKKVYITGNITLIGYGAFAQYNRSLELILPQTIHTVYSDAFSTWDQSRISYELYKPITFRETWGYDYYDEVATTLGRGYIGGGLHGKLTINEGIREIGWLAFPFCEISELTLPEGLERITYNAFYYNIYTGWSIEKMNIPSTVIEIDPSNFRSFPYPKMREFIIDPSNTDYVLEDGLLYSTEPRELLCVFGGMTYGTTIHLSDDITEIPDSMFAHYENITSIELPANLVSIGASAFEGCSDLAQIFMPEGLQSIGDNAFAGCTSLRQVVIPDSVTHLGSNVFSVWYAEGSELETVVFGSGITEVPNGTLEGCSKLQNVTFRGAVTTIGSRAFANCSSLTRIELPNTVTEIGNEAFSGCIGVTEVVLNEGLTRIENRAFDGMGQLTELTIPSTVTYIHNEAFCGCSFLNTVNNLSESVTFDYEYERHGADNLRKIVDPDGSIRYEDICHMCELIIDENRFLFEKHTDRDIVYEYDESIDECVPAHDGEGNIVFENTDIWYRLVAYFGDEDTVTVPASVEGSSIREIVIYQVLSDIKTVIFSDDLIETGILRGEWGSAGRAVERIEFGSGIETISDYAFNGYNSLSEIVIPDNVRSIGAMAFAGCENLQRVYIGKNVEYISQYAFTGCTRVEEFVIDPENDYFCFENGILYDIDKTQIIRVFPKMIPASFSLPDTLTGEIPDECFKGCTQLEELVIPEGITRIGSWIIRDCPNLRTVVFPESLEWISWLAFESSNIEEIDIRGNTALGSLCFKNCRSLRRVTLGAGVSVAADAFSECDAIEEFTVDEANPHICFENGIIYNKEMTSILFAYPGSLSGELVIPNTVTTIEQGAFNGNDITTLVIPSSVQYFGWYLDECKQLEAIEVDPANEWFASVDGVLYNKECTQILYAPRKINGSITIPDGITAIEERTFSERTELEGVTLPEGVVSIGYSAFEACSSLKSVYLPDTVTFIGEYAFAGTALHSVTLPANLEELRYGVFSGCRFLGSVAFNSNLRTIGECAFNGSGLITLNLPEGLETIEGGAFGGASTLTEIVFPSTLTYIADGAFDLDWNGDYVFVVENRSDIPIQLSGNSFGLNSIRKLTDKNGSVTYADGCEGFEYLDTQDGFRFMRDPYSYDSLVLLAYINDAGESLTLPSSYNGEAYELYMFRSNAEVLIIENSLEEIGGNAFFRPAECIIFGAGVKRISGNYYVSNLKKVIFGDDIESIGYNTFDSCFDLAEIEVPDKQIDIENNVLDRTDYYFNENNWKNGCLFIGKNLVKVRDDIQYITIPEEGAYITEKSYYGANSLKLTYNYIGGASNVETVVITEPLDLTLGWGWSGRFESSLTFTRNIVLGTDVRVVDVDAFYSLENIVIYVEALEKDCRWDENFPGWNNNNKVYYGDEWSWVTFYDENGKILLMEPVPLGQVVRRPHYSGQSMEETRTIFVGWDIDGDGIADRMPATLYDDLEATAVVRSAEALYTVNFYDDDRTTLLASYTCHYNDSMPKPETPAKHGYEFLGWVNYSEYVPVTEDLNFVAEWRHLGTAAHTYETTVVAPTCEAEGYTLHTCIVCGESYQSDFTEPAGHTMGEWVVDPAATCTTEGQRHRECSVCGHIETESIECTAHNFVVTFERPAHCYEPGRRVLRCSVCGLEAEQEIPAHPHRFERHYLTLVDYLRLLNLIPRGLFGIDIFGHFCYWCADCHQVECENDRPGAFTMSVQSFSCVDHEPGEWVMVTEATCSTEGTMVKYCTKCGEVADVMILPAEENSHIWVYDAETDTFSCSECAEVYGREFGELNVSVSHSATFANQLNLNYYVEGEAQWYEQFDHVYLAAWKDNYEFGTGTLLAAKPVTTLEADPQNNSELKFRYRGISSYEACDNIYGLVYAVKDGVIYKGTVDTYSLKTYATNRLSASSSADFKVMLVDFLNYAAQSQIYFRYRIDTLANADLTAEQLALASVDYSELVRDSDNQVLTNPSAVFTACSVIFGANTEIKVYFNLNDYVGDPSDLRVRFVYASETYNSVYLVEYVPFSEFGYSSDDDEYSAKFKSIPMYDARTPVQITLLDGDTPVSSTFTYSIETYAFNRLQASTNETFKELLALTMKYSDSAAVYFRNYQQ